MADNNAVKHHRVPKTYMKTWCFSRNSVWTYDKFKRKSEIRNIEKLFRTNYYHSIRAGFLYHTEDSLEKIFGFLKAYRIVYEEKELFSLEELNNHYCDFKKWEIYYPNGEKVNSKDKNVIKKQLESTKVNTIEEQWNIQLENDWPKIVEVLQGILYKLENGDSSYLTNIDADTILKYFVMFNWRGMVGNSSLNEVCHWIFHDVFEDSYIEIPENDRINSYDSCVADEMKHAFLLKAYDDFLNGKGVMYNTYQQYKEKFSFIFLLTKNKTFNTSDNPCFDFISNEGYRVPFFVVSPTIAIELARKDPIEPLMYKVQNLEDDEVNKYNEIIFENGNVILSCSPF